MECKHLISSVRLNRDFIKNKKNDLFGAVSPDAKTWCCLGNNLNIFFKNLFLLFVWRLSFFKARKKNQSQVFFLNLNICWCTCDKIDSLVLVTFFFFVLW